MCLCLPYVPLLFPSRYTISSIRLHKYVHGRTIGELPQRLADTILHSRTSFSCGKACPLVTVEARLMVRLWTYGCRRIEEVVYLQGKRKRILFPFPSRYTTSSIRLHTYVHGRTNKRVSTATSGHHSAQQNELFLWKSGSASRCGNSHISTSMDLRMKTYKGSSVPRRREEEDIRQTHAHTTLPCTPPAYSTYTPPFLLFHRTYHYHAKVHLLQQTRCHNGTSTENTHIYIFIHNHHKIQHLYTPVDFNFAISRES